ncbi:MAG: hypothetical protein HY879_21165 [Deltaproteobacteria bacterium]|nr:hypothetical protein [Deltaproteobacteria bacterium]
MSQIKEYKVWSDQRSLSVLIFLYLLFHLPFLGIGFGEPDAWRNGLNALKIGEGLGYSPNRIPGFPVVELAFGFLAMVVSPERLWVYTNLSTLLIALWGMTTFFKIARFHNISQPIVPVLLLYFIPVIFINAASSMDNLWAMTFLLIAYWLILQVKPNRAVLFFILAIGSRLTSAIFLFPFLIGLVWNQQVFPKKEAMRTTVLLIVSVIAMAAIYLFLNLEFLGLLKENVVIPRDYFRSGYYFMQQVFGLPGTLFLATMIVWQWKKIPSWNWEWSFLAMTAGIFGLLFLYRPEKPAYLIPVFPFFVLFISRWLKGNLSYILTGLIILNNIISFMVVQNTPQGLTLSWMSKGITWESFQRSEQYVKDADFLIRFPYPQETKVETGWRHPVVLYLLKLPAYQERKKELAKNGIVFPENLGKENKRHTYWVFGAMPYNKERQFLSTRGYQIIYPPSTQVGSEKRQVR